MHVVLVADIFDQIAGSAGKLVDSFGRMASTFDPEHWMIAVAVLLVVGWVCLRGFGSRKSF